MANAVLDGVDGILLGAETLRGRHPVATVDTILHICKQAEKVFDHHHHFERLMQVPCLLWPGARLPVAGAALARRMTDADASDGIPSAHQPQRCAVARELWQTHRERERESGESRTCWMD